DRVHADLAGLDLAGGGPLFEPAGRNTAAAVALATLRTLSEFGDSLVLVVPSDHEIATAGQFWQSIEAGSQAARAGRLVVFGIK
ncbi:MAG: mannose-1-phosphate guanylyltransferase, partial [Mesorhizobium sp.]